MCFPRPLILSAFFRCASAFFLLGTAADAHEGENHNVPAVNPNPQRLVIGANPLEVESGRLHVYCLEVPASGVFVTCEAVASAPFTVYQSRDKQPVLAGGQVTGASQTEPAEALEEEGGGTVYRARIDLLSDFPGKHFLCLKSDTAQAVQVELRNESYGPVDPFSGIDYSGTYQASRKLLPFYREQPTEGHATVELRYTVSTNLTRPAVPTAASNLLPEEGIGLPAPAGRFKDYVVMIRKQTTYPLPDGTTKTVVEFGRRDYRMLNGVPRLVPSDVLSGLNLTDPQECLLTVPARAAVRALVSDSWGGIPQGLTTSEGEEIPVPHQFEVKSASGVALNTDLRIGWFDFPVRSSATTYRLRLSKNPAAEYPPSGMGLRFIRNSVSGLADLVVNAPATQPYIVEADFPEDDGEVQDGLIPPGRHRVIRWNGVVENIGGLPAMVPSPNMQPGLFEFHQTHGHFHYLQFMESRLLTVDGKVATQGKKYSFALQDVQAFNPEAKELADQRMGLLAGYIEWRRMGGAGSAKLLPEAWRKTADAYFSRFLTTGWDTDRFRDFVCALSGLNPRAVHQPSISAYVAGGNPWSEYGGRDWCQRISPGHADVYGSGTPGQMINIDGIPAGNYVLEITVNPKGTIREANLSNNRARFPIYIPPVTSF